MAPRVLEGRIRLATVTGLILFIELGLIRWLGANVVYLSYFSNFVLLGTFLGLGIGFLRPQLRRLLPYATTLLLALTGIVLAFPPQIANLSSGSILVGPPQGGMPPWVSLPMIFLVISAITSVIAAEAAYVFASFKPLHAYRIDIFGSLAGIAIFTGLSTMGTPPIVWGLVATATLVALSLPEVHPGSIVGAVGTVVVLGINSFSAGHSWSPYYDIRVATGLPGAVAYIWVNQIPHQILSTVAQMEQTHSQALDPYLHLKQAPSSVLIIGSGNGKDVALALHNGAQSVDAVEIDPKLASIGTDLNPDRPYQDPRVHLHITDGRAFLEQTKNTYDLIVYAAPDSITLVLGQGSLRLESYLFTREGLEAARQHLSTSGSIAMFNYYWQDWYINRLAGTLQSITSHAPCLDLHQGTSQASLIASPDGSALSCASRWVALTGSSVPPPALDDQPFPYLEQPGIPTLILDSLLAVFALSLIAVRVAGGSLKGRGQYLDLFCMGAAFSLLETKSVVQFALLFGTTWIVNSIVFFGVLLAILVGIEVAQRFRPPLSLLYLLLGLALAATVLVPLGSILSLDVGPRIAAATTYAFVPILIANVIFARRFSATSSITGAFAMNLLGVVAGGLLEYSALVYGYRAMSLVVLGLYAIAMALEKTAESSKVQLT